MATNRYINTNFWKDSYVAELDPSEKNVFLYLLTNPQTTIAGVYEISLREMAFDTGYDKEMLLKILARFERDGKIKYLRGWIVLLNWYKHQKLNPSMKTGVLKILDELPEWLQQEIGYIANDKQTNLLEQPGDSLGTSSDIFNLIKFNIIKSNVTEPAKAGEVKKPSKAQYAKAVNFDKELKARELEAKNKFSNGYEAFSSAGEILKKRKLK